MDTCLDHEKLTVYQRSLEFLEMLEAVFPKIPKGLAARDQLDRASTSIPLNIAEGNGKFSGPDRCRFFDIARGSTLECAACLDVLLVKKALEQSDVIEGKKLLREIVSMLVGLIKSNASDRVYEERSTYATPDRASSQ